MSSLLREFPCSCHHVWAASLDDELQKLLFENNGPFETFGAKINVGFALRLYETQSRDDLKLISRIRNRFAHSIAPCSFSDLDVKQWCEKLHSPERVKKNEAIPTPRKRHIQVVVALAVGLVLFECV